MAILMLMLTLSLAAVLLLWGLCYLGSRPDCYQCPTCQRYWDRKGNSRIKVASGRVIELKCPGCRGRNRIVRRPGTNPQKFIARHPQLQPEPQEAPDAEMIS